MDYILSDHARKRMTKRGIRVEWLEITLRQPARTEDDSDDQTLAHVLRPIPEKGFRVSRAIYNETVDPVTVVTAYFGERPMKLEFDPQADAAYLELADTAVEQSKEIQPGIIVDYDADGQIVGIEILSVSKRAKRPLKEVA